MSDELLRHLAQNQAPMHTTRRLGAENLKVLLALCGHANKQRHAWPSLATLEEETGISVRQVRRALTDLQSVGWLVLEGTAPRGGSHGRPSNRYLICLPGLPALLEAAPDPVDNPSIRASIRASKRAPVRDELGTKTKTPPTPQQELTPEPASVREGKNQQPNQQRCSAELERWLGTLVSSDLQGTKTPGRNLLTMVRSELLELAHEAAVRFPEASSAQISTWALAKRQQARAMGPGPSTGLVQGMETNPYSQPEALLRELAQHHTATCTCSERAATGTG